MGKPEPISAAVDRVLASALGMKAEEMAPCILCDRPLINGELPLFGRFGIKRGSVDSHAILERVGMCEVWGSSPGAAILAEAFATRPPARIIDVLPEVNVCHQCMATRTVMDLMLVTMAKTDGERG